MKTQRTAEDPTEAIAVPEKRKKKKSKKDKKAKKEKRKRKRDEEGDGNGHNSENGGPRVEDGTRNLSKKQKGKEEDENDADPSGPQVRQDDVVSGKKRKKKEKKREKKSKKDKKKSSKKCRDSERKESSDEGSEDCESSETPAAAAAASSSSSSGRLVASSAIEFYDDDIKKKAKKRKLEAGNQTGTEFCRSGVETDIEAALESQRSKSKTKPKKDRFHGKEANPREELEQQKKLDKIGQEKKHNHSLTLLLFYQYIEPEWDDETHEKILRNLKKIGTTLELTGRMRCAKEGLNCTLTGTHESIMEYTRALRQLRPNDFKTTEFKLTTDLPLAQKFNELKVLPVLEIVRYGLEGQKAPPIQQYSGVHLEPKEYHKKLAESNTVIIDVRNHYEAAIGRFVPPTSNPESSKDGGSTTPTKSNETDKDNNGPQWIDPKMRKSTEFPAWLDKEETKQMMKGKQVLMYCTGGIRCERASALLKYKMENDQAVKDLGIKGVFQLQGGIDKYFKEFPDGGYWKGKNYVFDKRFAHAPPKIDGELHGRAKDHESNSTEKFPSKFTAQQQAMGKCEACHKPWDMYRGKRRCPTCGVPSLICKECFLADKEGIRKLGREVRCDLCVEQGIFTKRDYREKDERFIADYESKMKAKGLLLPNAVGKDGNEKENSNSEQGAPMAPNPKSITRLVLKNMCRKNMTEDALLEALPGITHIVWNTQRNRKNPSAEPIFTGMGWVEMATPEDASRAVAQSNQLRLFKRPLGIAFQPPDGKDVWPPSQSRVA